MGGGAVPPTLSSAGTSPCLRLVRSVVSTHTGSGILAAGPPEPRQRPPGPRGRGASRRALTRCGAGRPRMPQARPHDPPQTRRMTSAPATEGEGTLRADDPVLRAGPRATSRTREPAGPPPPDLHRARQAPSSTAGTVASRRTPARTPDPSPTRTAALAGGSPSRRRPPSGCEQDSMSAVARY